MEGRKVRVSFAPEFQVEMDWLGHIRFIVPGVSYPLNVIISRLVEAWLSHYGECNTIDDHDTSRKEVTNG